MKRLPVIISIAVILTTALLVSSVAAGNLDTGGTLKGPHYNLNIIGMNNTKNMPQNLDSGHTIFVKLNRDGSKVTTDINLTEGEFKVIDKDGTNGNAAFQLPYPLEADGTTACYEVYVRALGKPGGYANMYTCGYDTGTSELWCSTGNMITIKRPDGNGPSKFTKVTSELTTLSAGPYPGPIFKYSFIEYFWRYDNYGLKHAQLRFYYTGTCAPAPNQPRPS